METSRGLGGLFRFRTLPNSDEPMVFVSPFKRADEGRKRGHLVFPAFFISPWRRRLSGLS